MSEIFGSGVNLFFPMKYHSAARNTTIMAVSTTKRLDLVCCGNGEPQSSEKSLRIRTVNCVKC